MNPIVNNTLTTTTIKALRSRFHDVASTEVERVIGRLESKSERDRELVRRLAEAIANKLLHEPTTALKNEAADADASPLVDATTTRATPAASHDDSTARVPAT